MTQFKENQARALNIYIAERIAARQILIDTRDAETDQTARVAIDWQIIRFDHATNARLSELVSLVG